MKKIFYILTTVLFIASCHKDDYNTFSVEQFQKTDFPINIGNWWRYQVIDVFSRTIDTLTLKVISKETNNSQTKYNCELYQQGKLLDTSYYILSDSKIEYNGKKQDYSYFGNFYLSIPFKKGDKWRGVYFSQDTITASDKIATMKILGKDYTNVYSLNRNFTALGGYKLNQLLFISPKVGVIYQSFDLQDAGLAQKQTFQLIDYELK